MHVERLDSLRRHDPDQVRRVCSQPACARHPGGHDRSGPVQGLSWDMPVGHRARENGGMAVELARWDDLLQGEELAHLATEPAREARLAPFPDDLHPRVRDALPHRRALRAPARDVGRGAARRARRRHDRHRVGQDARVQPARARRDRARPEAAHALPLPDEGARAGPGAHARRVQAAAHARRDLRRRHAGRAALADPPLGEPHPHEPGHAPRRRPPAPRPLGRRALEPPLRRRRRGARLPRRLRLARRERPAPAAAARARLRRRAAVPARVGDDREPRRARAVAARRGRHRRRRRTRRRARSGRSRSGTRRCSTRSSASARPRSARRRGSTRRSSRAACGRSASRRAAAAPS